MDEFIFVGIDVAKDKFDAFFTTLQGKDRSRKFNNTETGHKHFIEWLSKAGELVWVCMESTGCYSEKIAEALYAENIHSSVVNPFQVKHFAKSKLARNKTDETDAKIIQQYALQMKRIPFLPRHPVQKLLREKVNFLNLLKKQLTAQRNLLRTFSSSEEIEAVEASIEDLESKVTEKGKEIIGLCAKHDRLKKEFLLLESIPGIGKATAAEVLAFLPDIERFKNGKQVAAFAGLNPRQIQSGKFRGHTKLSKMGGPNLRRCLFMPALGLLQRKDKLNGFAHRLLEKGKTEMCVIGALMHKLTLLIFGVLRSGKPYDLELHGAQPAWKSQGK